MMRNAVKALAFLTTTTPPAVVVISHVAAAGVALGRKPFGKRQEELPYDCLVCNLMFRSPAKVTDHYLTRRTSTPTKLKPGDSKYIHGDDWVGFCDYCGNGIKTEWEYTNFAGHESKCKFAPKPKADKLRHRR